MLAACWGALKPGGRLVANAVTVEAQSALMALAGETAGELARIAVSRSRAVGGFTGLKPFMDVLQLRAVKP